MGGRLARRRLGRRAACQRCSGAGGVRVPRPRLFLRVAGQPVDTPAGVAYPVEWTVNNPRNDCPECPAPMRRGGPAEE